VNAHVFRLIVANRGDDFEVRIPRLDRVVELSEPRVVALRFIEPIFVADFDNIATGWFRFREGEPPERVMDPSIDRAAPFPGEGFKRGFVMMVYSPKFFGGAAEFGSASIHLSNAIKDVYAQYEAGNNPSSGTVDADFIKTYRVN
jgi:hypothetical protein